MAKYDRSRIVDRIPNILLVTEQMGENMKMTKDDVCFVSQYNRKIKYIKLDRLREVVEELKDERFCTDNPYVGLVVEWDDIDELFGEVLNDEE